MREQTPNRYDRQEGGYDSEVETNVVDVYIRYLRNKLKPYGKDKIIETVRGVGYVVRK